MLEHKYRDMAEYTPNSRSLSVLARAIEVENKSRRRNFFALAVNAGTCLLPLPGRAKYPYRCPAVLSGNGCYQVIFQQ